MSTGRDGEGPHLMGKGWAGLLLSEAHVDTQPRFRVLWPSCEDGSAKKRLPLWRAGTEFHKAKQALSCSTTQGKGELEGQGTVVRKCGIGSLCGFQDPRPLIQVWGAEGRDQERGAEGSTPLASY